MLTGLGSMAVSCHKVPTPDARASHAGGPYEVVTVSATDEMAGRESGLNQASRLDHEALRRHSLMHALAFLNKRHSGNPYLQWLRG